MSLYIFVDSRSPSFQSFKQNAQISAYHEYVLTLISNYVILQKQYACIPPLHSLLVNSSPASTQLIHVSSSTPLGSTLRSRFSCTGTVASVVTNTWKMMQHSLNLISEKISPYEKTDQKSKLLLFLVHDLFLFGQQNEVTDDVIHAAQQAFLATAADTLLQVSCLQLRIVCVHTSGGGEDSGGQRQELQARAVQALRSVATVEFIENSTVYFENQLKQLLNESIPCQSASLALPCFQGDKASLKVELFGATLMASASLHKGLHSLELLCQVPSGGLDALCLQGQSLLLRPPSAAAFSSSGSHRSNIVLYNSLTIHLQRDQVFLIFLAKDRDLSQYWVLLPPPPPPPHLPPLSSKKTTTTTKLSLLSGQPTQHQLSLCLLVDKESFLRGHFSDSLALLEEPQQASAAPASASAAAAEAEQAEVAYYIQHSLQQVSRIERYNPLIFASGSLECQLQQLQQQQQQQQQGRERSTPTKSSSSHGNKSAESVHVLPSSHVRDGNNVHPRRSTEELDHSEYMKQRQPWPQNHVQEEQKQAHELQNVSMSHTSSACSGKTPTEPSSVSLFRNKKLVPRNPHQQPQVHHQQRQQQQQQAHETFPSSSSSLPLDKTSPRRTSATKQSNVKPKPLLLQVHLQQHHKKQQSSDGHTTNAAVDSEGGGAEATSPTLAAPAPAPAKDLCGDITSVTRRVRDTRKTPPQSRTSRTSRRQPAAAAPAPAPAPAPPPSSFKQCSYADQLASMERMEVEDSNDSDEDLIFDW